MRTRELTELEYKDTFGEPMRRLGASEQPPFDFWNYFDAIPQNHFAGNNCSEGKVEWVYLEPSGRFQHVLVNSDDKNVFMVLVLDCGAGRVHGHRLLNLNREYGLSTVQQQ